MKSLVKETFYQEGQILNQMIIGLVLYLIQRKFTNISEKFVLTW